MATSKGTKQLTPLVKVGQPIAAGQVVAAVVPVYTIVSDQPPVDQRHYLDDLDSFAESIRFAAAKALGLFPNDPMVQQALVKHLQSTSEHIFVLLEVAASLARFGNTDGWNFLQATLTGPFSENRLEAVIVLAEIDTPQARQLLVGVLRDPAEDVEVRAGAAWALGEHRSADALDALIGSFAETSPSIRIEAARAIVKLVPGARPDILRAFSSTDSQKRPGVAWVLSKTGGASVAELLPIMTTEDARQWAAYVIGTQDPPSYVGQIEQLRQRDPEVYFAVSVLWKILTSWVFDLREYG